MKTYLPAAGEVKRRWLLVDADGKVLGRLAARVATLLRGKHKPVFTPHMDTGDFVVVVNAAGVRLTGRKLQQKQMVRHSGYPGGLKTTPYEVLLRTHPERVVTEAVRGMLPKTRQGRALLKKLKVYRGAAHPHAAQKPSPVQL
ncbi:MAG: 50S ribosomal protein L13 [Armatimonadota bacterium]|nr:50S ribosomal protein L13 [Armatimonadota bacterium]MDR7422556.1 50S ribosomal protein L13 [Armatimonadota bacterium]MDR7454225.1 50S ribosomal protein L13 [Armatimonadota bacterium]MDR7457324.1 50S ribosomal protein L13 [Armatimonadota bacterium]MDR7512358.1 50S ribosomal protein L13 [Armatimonadota bacterium]